MLLGRVAQSQELEAKRCLQCLVSCTCGRRKNTLEVHRAGFDLKGIAAGDHRHLLKMWARRALILAVLACSHTALPPLTSTSLTTSCKNVSRNSITLGGQSNVQDGRTCWRGANLGRGRSVGVSRDGGDDVAEASYPVDTVIWREFAGSYAWCE